MIAHVRLAVSGLRARSAALKRQPAFVAALVSLLGAICIGDATLIVYLRQQAIDHGAANARNLAYVLAEQTDRTFQSVRLATGDIIQDLGAERAESNEDFEHIARRPATRNLLREKLTGVAPLDDITITSASGKPLSGAKHAAPPDLDLSGRDYIINGRTAPPGSFYVSQPLKSQVSGSWRLVLAHRVTSFRGEYLGVVAGVLELATLEQFYARLVLGPNGSVSISRRDGVLLARYPRVDHLIGSTIPREDLFPALDNSNGAVSRRVSAVDGRDRVLAAYATPHFPVVIVVTSALDDVLEPWRRQMTGLMAVGFASAVFIILLALVLAGSAEDLARAQSELVRAQERAKAKDLFHAAISNMRQGLAMFDGAGRLIVCNQQYADLYGLSVALMQAGTPRERIRAHRQKLKTYPRSREQRGPSYIVNELEDGRLIEIGRRDMSDGGWVSTHEDITEKRRTEERILQLARRDSLTDLPNRLHFGEKLRAALAAHFEGEQIAVLYLDLDRFKRVNDTWGHPVGDALLQKVARRLRDAVRAEDLLARLGGDEFAILQRVEAGSQEPTRLALRINAALKRPFDLNGQQVLIGSSIGISVAPDDTVDPDQIVRNADLALYAAKAAGRDTHRFFKPDMNDEVQRRTRLEQELRGGLSRNEFELHFQPQVRLADATLIGFEALLRWRHPRLGLLTPAAFIDLAEESGAIRELGEWAIGEACAQATQWPAHLTIAVNLSVAQLQSTTLRDCVAAALARTGLDPARLELEVTESVMLNEADSNLSSLAALRSLGVKIAMDDFGTGYSSLSCLRLFPFDRLKIDRCFIMELGQRADCDAIVTSTAQMAQTLGMATTAEGIETETQLQAARRAGCTDGQGYLFGRPVPAAEIMQILRAHDATRS